MIVIRYSAYQATGRLMSYKIFRLFIGILIFLTEAETFSQKILYSELNPSNGRFDNFLLNDGNSEPTTTCVFQDRKGFIWCGTKMGLYRFDGVKYHKYPIGNGDSLLIGYTVLSIFEDSDGTFWAGTYQALNRVNIKTGKIDHFFPDTLNPDSQSNTIRYINEDKKGLLWLITDRDIYTFDRKKEIFVKHPVDSLAWRSGHPFVVYVNDIFLEDSKGRIWIATDNGLYLFRQEDKSWKRILPVAALSANANPYKIYCVDEDSVGNILAGTGSDGLVKITEKENGSFEIVGLNGSGRKTEKISNVSAVFQETPDLLWYFANSTLYKLNPLTGDTESYLFPDIIPERSGGGPLLANKILKGRDGKLLIISQAMGYVYQFDRETEKLSLFLVPRYLVYSFIQDKTGYLWFGTFAQNMFRLIIDSLPFMTRSIPNYSSISVTNASRIAEDKDGNLWLALSEGLYKIKNPDIDPALRLEKIELPGEKDGVTGIYCDRNNTFWIGTNKSFVLNYLPSKHEFRKYTFQASDPYIYLPYVLVMRGDKRGNIWFSTYNHGIYRIKPGEDQFENVVTYKELDSNSPGSVLLDFNIDSNDNFWIATDYGLYKTDLNKNRIKQYTRSEGVESAFGSFNARIVADNNRRIWILNSMMGAQLYNYETDIFSTPENSKLLPIMGFSDLLIDKTGKLWFAEYGRVTVVDPYTKSSRFFELPEKNAEIHSRLLVSGKVAYIVNNKLYLFPENIPVNKIIPPVYITGLWINGKAYHEYFPESDNVTDLIRADLKFKQNTLRIEFAALNYIHPELNKYRYFMTGMDKDTVIAGPGSIAEYKQMPPGRYKFWINGSNNDNVWNKSGVSLDIHIHPPIYKSTLAYLVYLFALAALIAGYTRIRINNLQKEKMRLEGIVKVRTEELEMKNRQLAEIDKIKTHFFTDISHEIRTPLSLILGPLETITAEEKMSHKLSGLVELMKRNARRLMHLVNQLLDISRLDSGKMIINLTSDDIVKFLKILFYEFLSAAESKQIKYIVDLPGKELVTLFDKDKTEKIVTNILSNAFRYTPGNGTIQCIIKVKEIGKEQHLLEIKIVDSGPGIARENLDRIFDRFYRVEGTNETEGTGTGIGLSLSRELTTLLHGEIKVASEPGKGSEFLIILPLGNKHLSPDEFVIGKISPKENKARGVRDYASGHTWNKKTHASEGMYKILVIEDNPDLRNFIRESLASGYQVLGAENGTTGLYTAFTLMPDVIITDIMMPDISGITLCSQLKNDERTSHIPIIMLTAKTTVDDKLEGLKSGADDYIYKPFLMDELKIRIANLLAMREKLRLKYLGMSVKGISKEKAITVDDRFMEKVVRIINENISSFEFDVSELNESLGLSRMHISRKIKILTGLTPHILIRNIRLEKAADLILHGSRNVTEIANSVGISNMSGFSRAFREYFGVSPKKFTRQ